MAEQINYLHYLFEGEKYKLSGVSLILSGAKTKNIFGLPVVKKAYEF